MLQRQQDLFTKPTKKVNAATEALFKVANILTKHKKPITDGGIMKEAMTAVAETLFKDHKVRQIFCLLLPMYSLAQILWQGECLRCLQMRQNNWSQT